MRITNRLQTCFSFQIALFTVLLLTSCSTSRHYTLEPIKTFDPDTISIPEPEEKSQLQYWDRVDNTIFHQLEKPLDLNRWGQFVGKVAGISDGKQADNINHLDEVPNSSWYTNRHFHKPMSIAQLKKGPNTTKGPDTVGIWTIFQAKLEGATSGFFIRDQKGDRYLIKFDGYNYPELTTSAEVIGTKIFHAAGYTVPEATITYFDPEKVVVGEDVTVNENGERRKMTRQDYLEIINNRTRNQNGDIRALASKFVDGIPMGPWGFEGTRNDDPNDRVAHEHRRELRGMRVISSWLNDTDRRDANTIAVYNDQGYIDHYVQDFGNTLGANGSSIHLPIYGQAYLIDPRFMALSTFSLGLFVNSWETVTADPVYPSVGFFKADRFKPGGWVPAHPIPPFENATLRDLYWGAKLVMSFRDDEIRAIISTAELTHPQAEQYLYDVLRERRNMIGRYWFSRMNPLDKFKLVQTENGRYYLKFKDLGVDGNLYPSDSVYYRYAHYINGDLIEDWNEIADSRIDITDALNSVKSKMGDQIITFRIFSHRQIMPVRKYVDIYIHLNFDRKIVRIAGIDREE